MQNINGSFFGKDILSLDQFAPADLEILFTKTKVMSEIGKNAKPSDILKGKIVTIVFYEPSSRTFHSFAAACKQLGGQTLEVNNPQQFSSVSKGETLEDTIKVFEAYSDAIVIRHNEVGTAQKAADAAEFVPILNAGDGIGEHPTQALLDLYTIFEKKGQLDNLTGVMAGDLLNGRTIHSLIRGLALYPGTTLYLLSPAELKLSSSDHEDFAKRGVKLIEIESDDEIPENADFWYWTRVQKERFANIEDYEKVKNRFVVTPELMDRKAGENTILMHPLPRVGEIAVEVDQDERAVYLRSQVRNGMYVRMALLDLILNK